MSEHLLTVTELTVTRPGAKRPELDRLSLAVDAGETLVILGEAGCGKEALMRVLAGAPDRDEIVDGTLQFGSASPERAVKFPKPAIRVSSMRRGRVRRKNSVWRWAGFPARRSRQISTGLLCRCRPKFKLGACLPPHSPRIRNCCWRIIRWRVWRRVMRAR
jgi:energy-coupling factor transporter ATP-binding protein EcfA2